MGGTLKTDRVCRECNHRAGREIDSPFMRDWIVAMDRALHAPRGHRMQPRVEASLEDGTPVDIHMGKGPWKATVRAAIEWDGDKVTIRASNRAEYDKLVARVKRDVEAQGRQFTPPGEPTEIETDGPVVVTTKIDGVVWLRMAAKVTLACLSRVVDESWLSSDNASMYRGWLWDEHPVNELGQPALGFPSSHSELDRHVLDPPEHLLYFAPLGKGRVGLSIAYFGSVIVRSAVELGDLPLPRTGWRTGAGAPTQETTFDELLMQATLSLHDETEEDTDDAAR